MNGLVDRNHNLEIILYVKLDVFFGFVVFNHRFECVLAHGQLALSTVIKY
jgi:hypothetical protein